MHFHAFMERDAVHTQQLSEGDHATWFTVTEITQCQLSGIYQSGTDEL